MWQWSFSKKTFLSIFWTFETESKDKLCSICSTLDLQNLPATDELLGTENEDLVPFGTVEDVRRRLNCPFCRLVLHLVGRGDAIVPDQDQFHRVCNNESSSAHSWCAIRRSKNVFQVLDHFGLQGFICTASRLALPSQALDDIEYVGSTFGRHLDIPLVRDWIRACDAQHHLCGTSLSPLLSMGSVKLILIDARNNCLVEATSAERYIALSYVWGTVRMLQTTVSNWASLQSAGAFLKHKDQIPRCIRDAITLVSLLNERYLWVDSLCIIQDDVLNKHEQIQNMSVVYGRAFLTIIAASGQDANYALPGVSFHSRPQLYAVADVAENRLIARPLKMKDLLPSSPYESRAWTYQERVLSRRCLILTTHQAYYHCSTGLQSDISSSLNLEDSKPPKSLNPIRAILEKHLDVETPRRSSLLSRTDLLLYDDIIQAYSARGLSFQSDKLNAFAGIEAVLKNSFGSDFVYGLPEQIFDVALHWTTSQAQERIQNTHVTSRIQSFPSWSWVSHNGPVKYFEGPLQCLIRDESSPIISNVADFAITINNTCSTLHRLSGNLVHLAPNHGKSQCKWPAETVSSLEDGTLSFRARYASFDSFLIEGVDWDFSFLILYDSDRKCCGRVWPDWPDSKFYTHDLQRQSCELVLLSYSGVLDEKNSVQLGYHYDVGRFPITGHCMANALLVKSNGECAERIAIVQLHIRAWENAERKEKHFNLR